MDPTTAAMQALAGAANLAAEKVNGLVGPFAQLVQASNPGEMLRFQMAMQDLAASLGVIFEPIVIAGEQVADMFNTMFTELQPVIGPVIQQLADIFKELGRAAIEFFEPILRAVVPVFGQLLESLRPLIPPLQLLATTIGQMFAELIRSLQPLLQLILPPLVAFLSRLAEVISTTVTTITVMLERLRAGNIRGALNLPDVIAEAMRRVEESRRRLAQARPQGPRTGAARQAQTIGIEELGQRARAAAFGARNYQEEQVGLLTQIRDRITTLINPQLMQRWADAVTAGIGGPAGAFVGNAAAALQGVNGI